MKCVICKQGDTAPGQVTVGQINQVLRGLNLAPVDAEELSPLQAA